MVYLITGAQGQLGIAFSNLFNTMGLTCLSTDVDELDITDIKAIRSFIRQKNISYIINCAAYNLVDKAEEDWKAAYTLNALGPKNLAIASYEVGIPIVHFSTSYVFDGLKKGDYTIVDETAPLSVYGSSKLRGEEMVKECNPKHIIIRTSWLFGDGPVNFVKKVIKWSTNDDISIVTDEISAPTYAPDLALMSYELIKNEAYGLYHLTNEGQCSRFEWANFILNYINWNGSLKETSMIKFNLPANRPLYSKLDNFGFNIYSDISIRGWKEATAEYLDKLKLE